VHTPSGYGRSDQAGLEHGELRLGDAGGLTLRHNLHGGRCGGRNNGGRSKGCDGRSGGREKTDQYEEATHADEHRQFKEISHLNRPSQSLP
jgi:hypothetical protein